MVFRRRGVSARGCALARRIPLEIEQQTLDEFSINLQTIYGLPFIVFAIDLLGPDCSIFETSLAEGVDVEKVVYNKHCGCPAAYTPR